MRMMRDLSDEDRAELARQLIDAEPEARGGIVRGQ